MCCALKQKGSNVNIILSIILIEIIYMQNDTLLQPEDITSYMQNNTL